MEALRIHVERIVRPVRAYGGRKNKMREELLAHLEQRADAARQRGMPDDEAISLAIESLGDPMQLRAELQESVQKIERLSFVGVPNAVMDGWFDKRERETALHFAWVRTAYTVVFMIVTLVPIITAMDGAGWLKYLTEQTAWHWNSNWAVKHCYVPVLVVCSATVATFAAYFVADVTGIRKGLSSRVAASLLFRVVSLELFIGGYLLSFAAFTMLTAFITVRTSSTSLFPPQSAVFGFESIAPILAPSAALLVLAGLPAIAWVINKEHQQYEKWGRLEIDQ